jgi:hypothetical protein
MICTSFIIYKKKCRSYAYLNENDYISKSFYVAELVTSTMSENFLLRAHKVLKPGGHKEMSSILADQWRPRT